MEMWETLDYSSAGIALAGIGLFLLGLVAIMLRRVVATNEVHIVQSRRATTSYGTNTSHGNTYYEWPAWMPVVGITRIILPVSVFDVTLQGYEAYDKGRVPFVVDVVAFPHQRFQHGRAARRELRRAA